MRIGASATRRLLFLAMVGICLAASAAGLLAAGSQAATPPLAGAKKIAVILVNFRNTTPPALTVEDARREIFTGPKSANSYYKEVSGNRVSLRGKNRVDGDVFGWVTIPFDSTGACSKQPEWVTAAKKAAGNLSGYDKYIVVMPAMSCSPNASAQEARLTELKDTITTVHELGHTFGLPHAGSLTCKNAAGVQVHISEDCKREEYGDGFDPMGAPLGHGLVHFGNWSKAKLGILGGPIPTITKSGSYFIAPSELGSTNSAQGIRVPAGKVYGVPVYYYVDYRRPIGLDSHLTFAQTDGIYIRWAGSHTDDKIPALALDGALSGTVSAFPTGRKFNDPMNQISIQATSATADGVWVDVDLPTPATGSIEVDGKKLRIESGANQANDLRVFDTGAEYWIDDHGSSNYKLGKGCRKGSAGIVMFICKRESAGTIEVRTHDRGDQVRLATMDPATVFGGAGDDQIHGGFGNDVIDGGAGSDSIVGWDGVDTVDYSRRETSVAVAPGSPGSNDGEDLDQDGVGEEGDNVDGSVEAVIGGFAGDRLTAPNSGGALIGGPGKDFLYGQDGPDALIAGGGGSDQLRGGKGSDWLIGATVDYSDRENDLTIDLNRSTVTPAPGETDLLVGVSGAIGGGGDDRITGNAEANHLRGGPGKDVLRGGRGRDTLEGESDEDVLDGGRGTEAMDLYDLMDGGPGIDTVDYSDRAAKVWVFLPGTTSTISSGEAGEYDFLMRVESATGGSGRDELRGAADDNVLTGNGGADSFYGAQGVDTIRATDGVRDAYISCGSEVDVLFVDLIDPLESDCP